MIDRQNHNMCILTGEEDEKKHELSADEAKKIIVAYGDACPRHNVKGSPSSKYALLQKAQREGDLYLSGRVSHVEELLILPPGNEADEAA
jgi:hypothetical protein